MRSLIFGLLTLCAAPVAAMELPADMLGHWETDLANCGDTATAGHQISLEQDAGDVVLFYVNHATEGGSCVLQAFDAGAVVAMKGQCQYEEGPTSEQGFLTMVSDGDLVLFSDWVDGKPNELGSELILHRCPGA